MTFRAGSSMWLVRAAVAVACVLAAGVAVASERNACGCTQTDSGACICDKKAKCGCPGSCEPQGCEERRDRALQKEIELETKKARDADKQRAAPQSEATPKAAAEPAAPRPARALPPAQVKQLARLLDLYFAAHPNARRETAGDLRDEIQRAR